MDINADSDGKLYRFTSFGSKKRVQYCGSGNSLVDSASGTSTNISKYLAFTELIVAIVKVSPKYISPVPESSGSALVIVTFEISAGISYETVSVSREVLRSVMSSGIDANSEKVTVTLSWPNNPLLYLGIITPSGNASDLGDSQS